MSSLSQCGCADSKISARIIFIGAKIFSYQHREKWNSKRRRPSFKVKVVAKMLWSWIQKYSWVLKVLYPMNLQKKIGFYNQNLVSKSKQKWRTIFHKIFRKLTSRLFNKWYWVDDISFTESKELNIWICKRIFSCLSYSSFTHTFVIWQILFCLTQSQKWGIQRIELTDNGLLAWLSNHYITWGS